MCDLVSMKHNKIEQNALKIRGVCDWFDVRRPAGRQVM